MTAVKWYYLGVPGALDLDREPDGVFEIDRVLYSGSSVYVFHPLIFHGHTSLNNVYGPLFNLSTQPTLSDKPFS